MKDTVKDTVKDFVSGTEMDAWDRGQRHVKDTWALPLHAGTTVASPCMKLLQLLVLLLRT